MHETMVSCYENKLIMVPFEMETLPPFTLPSWGLVTRSTLFAALEC
jgi:hypothetical protein